MVGDSILICLQVTYPGLPSNPDHALAKSLIDESFGYGGLLGIEFDSADVAQVYDAG